MKAKISVISIKELFLMLTFIETILHEAEAGNFSFFILTVDLILVAIGIANLYKKTR